MVDLLFGLVLFWLFLYALGVMIMIWRPFFVAISQGKSLTEIYDIRDLLLNMVRALIWPYYMIRKSG